MDTDLAAMIANDMKTGPGSDLGVSVSFEASKKRGRIAFTLADVPVSGIPFAESGKIDVDLDNWAAQAAVAVADCPYQPDIGQVVSILSGPASGLRCRISRVTPDPSGGIYAIEMEPMTRA
jgi:hypothetical protein